MTCAAMRMAMAGQTSWNSEMEKTSLVFIEPVLHLRPAKPISALANNNTSTSAVKGKAAYENAINISSGDVRALCKQGRLKEALDILHVMDRRGIRPESSMYASLLQGCVDMKALPEGKLIHAHIIQTGLTPDVFLGTKLIIVYANCGSLVDARRVLEEIPKRNVVSWTAMIAAYARHGHGEEAFALFYQMQRTGIQPDEFAFASVLLACADLAALKHGKEVHDGIIRSGFQSDIFLHNALVDMYAKCASLDDARNVFDKMSERNEVSWNAMIAAYAWHGRPQEAFTLFYEMQRTGIQPDPIAFATIIPACANLEALKKLHEDVIRSGFQFNVFVGSALAGMYAKCGKIENARNLFDRMLERNVVSWNAMIAGYAQVGYVHEAIKLFEKMPGKNVISWTAMVAGYAQNGCFDKAIKLFQQMQLTCVKPTSATFASVLPACASLAALQRGKEAHESIIRSGFQADIFVGNALVDMYAKCGNIDYAFKVFNKMPEQNVISWNSMIGGYAMHGCGKEALQLFEQMRGSDTMPDNVTFIGVLTACCHAGLVDDAWQYFEHMGQDYNITPAVEHYCCMVDLLGRAGQLDEAHEFIKKMPIKPNAAVWGSLLGACRIHTNIELGEHIAVCLFESNPENSAHYVLLSNIYAAAGRWNDREKVRKLMKDRKIKKTPGCSWIEVNDKMYVFLIGDTSHPQTDEIYAELERLSGQMKEAGYVPDTNFVLHDVEEEQKEHILCHHSEKLAIAFGLINTSPGTIIRIVKNLRVCGDCHSAIKFISKIVAREIVLRDANRYHHFKDGCCACRDYW